MNGRIGRSLESTRQCLYVSGMTLTPPLGVGNHETIAGVSPHSESSGGAHPGPASHRLVACAARSVVLRRPPEVRLTGCPSVEVGFFAGGLRLRHYLYHVLEHLTIRKLGSCDFWTMWLGSCG